MRAGLSLDQAPPFAIPLGFYLSAPPFLAAAGILAAWPGWAWTGSRWAPAAIALVHLVALGYLGLAMLGSLAQMLPVVAGTRLPAGRWVSRAGNLALLAGVPLLAYGMGASQPWALLSGGGLAGMGLAVFAVAAGIALLKARATDTVRAMGMALASLALVLPLGLALAIWLAGKAELADPATLANLHAGFALLGWVLLLVMGVAYQVVPMLQLTPNYPPRLTRWLAGAMFILLLAWAALAWTEASDRLKAVATVGLAGLTGLFALITLDLQRRRRRKVGDATLDYWRLAMASLLLCVPLGLTCRFAPSLLGEAGEVLLGLVFLLGFAVGVVNGMLFKILPFLAWFHLNAQVGMGRASRVNMKDFIADTAARRQLRLHLAALGMLLPSPWLPWLALPGGLLLAVSAVYLEVALARAYRLFRARGGHAG